MAANIIRNFDSCWTLEGALFLAPDDNDESDRVALITIRLFSEISTMQLFLRKAFVINGYVMFLLRGHLNLGSALFQTRGG